jgi:hypothetical protein
MKMKRAVAISTAALLTLGASALTAAPTYAASRLSHTTTKACGSNTVKNTVVYDDYGSYARVLTFITTVSGSGQVGKYAVHKWQIRDNTRVVASGTKNSNMGQLTGLFNGQSAAIYDNAAGRAVDSVEIVNPGPAWNDFCTVYVYTWP